MTDHTYAGYTAEQIRAAAESGLWSQFINVARPETVLALLDRIAELEQRANAAEGWHLIETGRADELQANVYLDRDEIAGLRVQNDQLLAACRKAVLALGHAAERHPVYRRDYDALSTAIDATRAQPAE